MSIKLQTYWRMLISEVKAAFRDGSKWSGLRALSNQRVTQLTILMPLIGYVILFNQSLIDYLHFSEKFVAGGWFGAYRLFLIYFGLTCVGIASMIFQARCPSEVKSHGSAWEFVAREADNMSRSRLESIRKSVLALSFAESCTAIGVQFDRIYHAVETREQKDIETLVQEATRGQDGERIAMVRNLASTLGRRWSQYDYSDVDKRTQLLHDYFVPLKTIRPTARKISMSFYIVGMLMLIVPAVELFGRVFTRFIRYSLGS